MKVFISAALMLGPAGSSIEAGTPMAVRTVEVDRTVSGDADGTEPLRV